MGHADACEPGLVRRRGTPRRHGLVLRGGLLRVAGAPAREERNVDGTGAGLRGVVPDFCGAAGVQIVPRIATEDRISSVARVFRYLDTCVQFVGGLNSPKLAKL